jgi:biotin carboxyl carrier protein
MSGDSKLIQVAEGTYLVEHDGRSDIVYLAGPPTNRWAFWNGLVFTADVTASAERPAGSRRTGGRQELSSPMPATIVKVLVDPGGRVQKGDVVLVLEAMKMELPIRAPFDANVTAVHCHEGQLVQADSALVDIEEA